MNNKNSTSIENPAYHLTVASPGRINLIGEHTDYNNGFVLPTAVDKKIYFKIRKNGTPTRCQVTSENFNTFLEFDLKNFKKSPNTWENYILGVVDELQKQGKIMEGFDCTIRSELPIGAGISSSAALECGLASGLNELFDLGLTKMEIVKLSQSAENNFVGSNCGIMDQYSSVMSMENQIILLDCKSLKAEYIPSDLKGNKILLLNTNVSHSLADSEYNTRRRECEESVKIIQQKYPQVTSLRDVDEEKLAEFRHILPGKFYQRCLYVIQENQRVLTAANAMKSGNLSEFGNLMYESHHGLQHLYEVSCPELDFLVDFSRNKDFILGSRMMGGGFGGCTINLIQEEKINSYIDEVAAEYKKRFNIDLDAFTVVPSEGTTLSVTS